jgi:hypothetical protein
MIVTITDDKVGKKYQLLTLNAGTVFTTTPAVYTITPGILPRSAKIGPVEVQAVRITYHGEDPVVATKVGHLLSIGDSIDLTTTADIVNFRAVREAAVTAYVPITYSY